MVRKIVRAQWGLPPVVADLHELAHDDYGVRNAELLGHMTYLAEHIAIVQRTVDGLDVRHALTRAVEDLATVGGGAPSNVQWTAQENDAVKALLFLSNSVSDGKREQTLTSASKQRAAIASVLMDAPSEPEFRRRRRLAPEGDDTDVPRHRSIETDLLTRFVMALDSLDATPSHTRGFDRTPPPARSAEPPVGIEDLLGTWRGETASSWLLKDRGAGRGAIPCFMILESCAGQPHVRWLYRSGGSVAVAVRVAGTSAGRRILAVYESDLTHTLDGPRPSHRGACMLDVEEVEQPNERTHAVTTPIIAGHYWTDRQTQGTLRFTRRVEVVAEDFAAGVGLFSP